MTFKHYDVVRAASPSDLAEQLTQKIKEGWQPFGSPVAITPYTLMQAIAAEGDVSTAVVSPGDDNAWVLLLNRSFTMSSRLPDSPMAWLTVKGFRYRIHLTALSRALSNWPDAVR